MSEQENLYFRCRKRAARNDDRLSSREKAAELIGISPSQLANYELGITKSVPVDSVVLMADLYRCPEIKARYCAESCPIGAQRPTCTQAGSIESLAVRMACLSQAGALHQATLKLLEIARDGQVSEAEKEELAALALGLTGLEELIQEMRLKAEGR